jgi:hypothetical protein
MKLKYPFPQKFHYLTVLGKYLTSTNIIATSGTFTGPLKTNTVCDYVYTPNHKELAINLTIVSVSGTSPTLTAYFDALDPIEPQNVNINSTERPPVLELKFNSTAITGATRSRLVIANGVATAWISNASTTTSTTLGNMNVPYIWQIRFAISGTSPSYSITGTYEARE